METAIQSLLGWAGARWPGAGEGLLLRALADMWTWHLQFCQCRDVPTQIGYKRKFRSLTFSFSPLELQIAEAWIAMVEEIMPEWIIKKVFNDMVNLLDDDCDLTVAKKTDAASEFTVASNNAHFALTQKSRMRLKMESNFCPDFSNFIKLSIYHKGLLFLQLFFLWH